MTAPAKCSPKSTPLRRLDDGTCGYCEETGEPIATLSIDAQERHERPEKTCRDD